LRGFFFFFFRTN